MVYAVTCQRLTPTWLNQELRLARCIVSLLASIAGSFHSAHAAQNINTPLRLPTVEEFVVARVTPSVNAEPARANPAVTAAGFRPNLDPLKLGYELTPTAANALSAGPVPTRREPQDPAVPQHATLSDRFYIGLGAFFATSSTNAALRSPSGVGASVSFEDTLGLDERDWTPQVLARFRMTPRWRLELEYFSLHRSSTETIDVQIDWGGQTHPIGTQIHSKFNIDVARFSVGYSFFKRPDKEIGIALGVHMTDIDAELSSAGGSSRGSAALAPLPVLSTYGQVALTDRWAVDGRLDIFKMEYGPYQGSVFSLGLDLVYMPWRHVGFGLGYRSLTIDLDVDQSDWNGSVNTYFRGPIAFVCASF